MSSVSSSLSSSSTKWVNQIETEAPLSTTNGIQILNLIKPLEFSILTLPAFPAELTNKYKAIQILRALQQDPQITREKLAEIDVQLSAFENIEQLTPVQSLVKELVRGNYDTTAINKYLSWSLQLALTSLHGHSPLDARVNKLYQRVLHGNDYTITPRSEDDRGHSIAYMLSDKTSNVPFAILKQSDPEYFSSYTRHLPEMRVTAPVWEHEMIGYEQDQLLGNHTPATLGVHFLNTEQKKVRGTIQEYIPNAREGYSYYTEAGAEQLLAIPKSEVQLTALSGLIKGLSAGHMNNYIIETPQDRPEESRIYEIDLEEMLLPFNRISETEKMKGMSELDEQIAKLKDEKEINSAEVAKLEEKKQVMRASLILGRLWILGLPQCEKPFDRAILHLMANPTLSSLLEQYQQEASKYSSVSEASWNAQKERVKIMQEMALEELQNESPTLTPRDLYFKIFGGEHLWSIAQSKNWPALIAFNDIISDPYQHNVKDFSNPDNILPCRRAPGGGTSPVSRFLFKMEQGSQH